VNSKYIIRQPDRADREFTTSQEAVEHLVSNSGFAKLFVDGQLVMTKGIPPESHERDPHMFRGLFAAAAEG
jgi:hypothetical protein